MISFQNAHIGYENSLLEVCVEKLENNTSYALIGANGSGKSTFLKSIAGILPCVQGEIHLNGQTNTQFSLKELAQLVAYVPPRFQLQGQMKVEEFIALGRTPYLNPFGKIYPKDKEIIVQAIAHLQIDYLKDKFMHQLSDGEKQLCSLSRALCQNTSIILLDEPTSFLDYNNKQLVMQAIQSISKKNKLIVFSSHELDMVSEFTSKVLYTASGKLQLLEEVRNKNELIEAAF